MHFLSILGIFKNEEMSLDLWVRHYCWMGVDHFYLIDNGSTDGSRKVLELYEKQGIVSVFYLPEKYKQQDHYRHVYDNAIKDNTVWIMIADLDEFWYVKNTTIKKQLPYFDKYHVIHSKWRMFGSDGLIQQPEDIRISITHRQRPLHPNTKCIFQTKHIESRQMTIHTIEDEPNQFDGSEVFRLNHYPIQSWEYFQKIKMNRGDAISSTVDNFRDETYFKNYDMETTFEDVDLQQMVLQQQIKDEQIKLFQYSAYGVVFGFMLYFVCVFLCQKKYLKITHMSIKKWLSLCLMSVKRRRSRRRFS